MSDVASTLIGSDLDILIRLPIIHIYRDIAIKVLPAARLHFRSFPGVR